MKCPMCKSTQTRFVHHNQLGFHYRCYGCDRDYTVGNDPNEKIGSHLNPDDYKPNQQKENEMSVTGMGQFSPPKSLYEVEILSYDENESGVDELLFSWKGVAKNSKNAEIKALNKAKIKDPDTVQIRVREFPFA